MNRRDYLKSLGLIGIGIGGYAAYDNQDVIENQLPENSSIEFNTQNASVSQNQTEDEGSNLFGPPPTEEKIREKEFVFGATDGPFDSIVFYESGAAEVYFNTGHDMDEFAITHISLDVLDEPFEVWDAPTYTGPVTIDLKSTLEDNGPYPRNKFKLGAYFNPNEEYLMYMTPDPKFRVPENWIELMK